MMGEGMEYVTKEQKQSIDRNIVGGEDDDDDDDDLHGRNIVLL